jgi:hypothetical protein
MATSFDSFLPYILPYAPGASDLAVYQALRDAAIDFTKRSQIVQRVSAHNVVATTQIYTPTAVSDMQVNRIIEVWWNGRLLAGVAPEDVESDTALQGAAIGTNALATGGPTHYFQKLPTDQTVSLYPVPDEALTNGLTIRAAFIPTLTAVALEDVLFNDYVEALAAGALMRLVLQPNEPYSNPPAAPAYKAVFEAGVNEAKRSRAKGKTSASRRVRPVRWP